MVNTDVVVTEMMPVELANDVDLSFSLVVVLIVSLVDIEASAPEDVVAVAASSLLKTPAATTLKQRHRHSTARREGRLRAMIIRRLPYAVVASSHGQPVKVGSHDRGGDGGDIKFLHQRLK